MSIILFPPSISSLIYIFVRAAFQQVFFRFVAVLASFICLCLKKCCFVYYDATSITRSKRAAR